MNIGEILKSYEKPKTKMTSERQGIVKEFFDALTLERRYDNMHRWKSTNAERMKKGLSYLIPEDFKKHKNFLKPLTARYVAVTLSHLDQDELYRFLSSCRDYKHRNGSFSKMFFGALKTRK